MCRAAGPAAHLVAAEYLAREEDRSHYRNTYSQLGLLPDYNGVVTRDRRVFEAA